MDAHSNNKMAHHHHHHQGQKPHKQHKKGFMLTNFYKFSTSKSQLHNHKPQSKSDPIPSPKVDIQHKIDQKKTELKMPSNAIASLLLGSHQQLPRRSKDFEESSAEHGCGGWKKGGGGEFARNGGMGMGAAAKAVTVEGRKSVSQVETVNLPAVATFLSVKVLAADMPAFMQVHAFRCARRTFDSLEKFSSKHLAFNLKKEFDKVYGPAWHCIVGSSFGSFVTHSTGCFLYFSMENFYILIFKTKVRRAHLD